MWAQLLHCHGNASRLGAYGCHTCESACTGDKCTIKRTSDAATFTWKDGGAKMLPINSKLISGSAVLQVLEDGDSATLPISLAALEACSIAVGDGLSPDERAAQLYSMRRTAQSAGHLQAQGWDAMVKCLLVRYTHVVQLNMQLNDIDDAQSMCSGEDPLCSALQAGRGLSCLCESVKHCLVVWLPSAVQALPAYIVIRANLVAHKLAGVQLFEQRMGHGDQYLRGCGSCAAPWQLAHEL